MTDLTETQGTENTQVSDEVESTTETVAVTETADNAVNETAESQNGETETGGDTLLTQDTSVEETQTEEGSSQETDENSDDGDSEQDQDGAPEEYDLSNENAADGSPVVAAFSEVAKELNLTQKQFDSVLEKVRPVMTKQNEDNFNKVNEMWVEQVKADEEIGGDKLQESLTNARKVFDAFGDDELNHVLNSTGLGNHPAVVRFVAKAGKAISEDTFVGGKHEAKQAPTTVQGVAESLYS